MVVVVPMAGRGTRFSEAGYDVPKPLIAVAGKPMVLWALKSIEAMSFDRLVIVALREHDERYDLRSLLGKYKNIVSDFVFLDDVTEGQLCTVLAAQHYFDNGNDVLITASDTYIQSLMAKDINDKKEKCSGLISVTSLPGEQWSFARTDQAGRVVEVAEKRRISENCSTGMYYFSNADDLVSYGSEIIKQKERTRNEYYVIPVYQKMINAGKIIYTSQAEKMWDMGTPQAKEIFENTKIK